MEIAKYIRILVRYGNHLYAQPKLPAEVYWQYKGMSKDIAERDVEIKKRALCAIWADGLNLSELFNLTIPEIPLLLEQMRGMLGEKNFDYEIGPRPLQSDEEYEEHRIKNPEFRLWYSLIALESYLNELTTQKIDPVCVTENGIGFLVIDNNKIEVGKIGTRKFRLLESLCDPFGLGKTIDSVFDNIRLDKDSLNPSISGSHTAHVAKLVIIESTFGEIQEAFRKAGSPDVLRLKFPDKRTIKLIRP